MAKGFHDSKTPISERDSFRTPMFVYEYFNSIYKFSVDAACTRENCLAPIGFHAPMHNAFDKDWFSICESAGVRPVIWVNPPYSCIPIWLDKVIDESRRGCTIAFLVNMPNGEAWHRTAFENASELILINGRLAFIGANGPVNGNNRGSCVYIFRHKSVQTPCQTWMIDRDAMLAEYNIFNRSSAA